MLEAPSVFVPLQYSMIYTHAPSFWSVSGFAASAATDVFDGLAVTTTCMVAMVAPSPKACSRRTVSEKLKLVTDMLKLQSYESKKDT